VRSPRLLHASSACRCAIRMVRGSLALLVVLSGEIFALGGGHGEKKQRVLDRFAEFFERYFGLG
jgi:hypothetical protein